MHSRAEKAGYSQDVLEHCQNGIVRHLLLCDPTSAFILREYGLPLWRPFSSVSLNRQVAKSPSTLQKNNPTLIDNSVFVGPDMISITAKFRALKLFTAKAVASMRKIEVF